MYSVVVTYGFKEDKIRRSLSGMLEEWSFEKRRDMSIYALNKNHGMTDAEVIEGIIGWSKTVQKNTGEKFSAEDFIEVYIAGIDSKGKAEIRAHAFTYDPVTGMMQ